MESVDIETLNFDEYNREVYRENISKDENPHFHNGQKNYKIMINKFVENYYKNRNDKNESNEDNFERKKRKF